jgi:hypothetical protein
MCVELRAGMYRVNIRFQSRSLLFSLESQRLISPPRIVWYSGYYYFIVKVKLFPCLNKATKTYGEQRHSSAYS